MSKNKKYPIRETIWEFEHRLKQEAKTALAIAKQQEKNK